MDELKPKRLLRVMKMLTANNSLTDDEIAAKLAISERSVYRYIDTFRAAGFVMKKTDNFIKLDKSSPYFKDSSEVWKVLGDVKKIRDIWMFIEQSSK